MLQILDLTLFLKYICPVKILTVMYLVCVKFKFTAFLGTGFVHRRLVIVLECETLIIGVFDNISLCWENPPPGFCYSTLISLLHPVASYFSDITADNTSTLGEICRTFTSVKGLRCPFFVLVVSINQPVVSS